MPNIPENRYNLTFNIYYFAKGIMPQLELQPLQPS